MKKFFLTLACLTAFIGMQAQQTWNFTVTSEADVALLKAATDEWSYTESSDRYQSKKAIDGPLTAGGQVLALSQGLRFTAAAEKIRIDVNKRVQLAGKNTVITIPALKKGQQLTISFASTGTTAVTFDKQTNLASAQGFTKADKETTQNGTATVAADGDVTLASSDGSINVYSISVSASPGDDPSKPADEINNNVARNMNVNQALLSLNTGDLKCYNTGDLSSISFSGNDVLVSTLQQATDVFHGTVTGIAFAKRDEQGQPGEVVNGSVEITEAKGWLETIYLKWKPVEGATSYNVYVRGGRHADFTLIDQQLVRNYGSYVRADILGLVAASGYEVKVVPTVDGQEVVGSEPSTASGIDVKAYDRSGYAHFNYPAGVGAYTNEGVLKAGAKVFYVTKTSAKTIKTTVKTGSKDSNISECTGLQAIIDAYQKGYDTTPIAFRFIGLVTKDDLDAISSSEEGIQIKGKNADSELNITIEGVGDDATLYGFGFLVRNAKSVEFRNIGIMRCMDDGISLDTDNSNIWVHHTDVFYGKHGSGDHAKGDGSTDVKSDSKYVTVSYNRYWDTGKTNMFGMKSESGPNYISYHHNWFDHSDSRHPRVRTMTVHVWNNFFDNCAKYGVGATTGASVFVENNYFLKTKKPILCSLQGTDGLGSGTFSGEEGGMIKAFGNYFDRSAAHFSYYTQAAPSSKGYDAYETATRDEQVPEGEKSLSGSNTYNNFDTTPQLIYDYTPDAAADVPAIVTGYYGAGRLNHGDFQYSFADNKGDDDGDSEYDSNLGSLLDNYHSSLVSIYGDDSYQGGGGGDQPGDEPGTGGDDQPEGTILASFDATPSHPTMFTVGGSYGDGKITYEGVYYKKGVKFDSKGSITFTPQHDYQMTLILGTAKPGRDVNLNNEKTTVGGTENTEGAYYEMEPISISAGTPITLSKGSAEGLVMLIKLVPAGE